MKKLPLLLDCDDSLFRTKEHHLEYINSRYGIATVLSDYTNNPSIDTVLRKYLPGDQIFDPTEIYLDLAKNFLESIEQHSTVFPIEGVREVIPKLAKKYELWIVTARPVSCRHVVQHLVNTYIPNCIHDMHFVWKYLPEQGFVDHPKRKFMEGIQKKPVGFLDDSVTEILKVQDFVPSYLFDPHHLHDAVLGINNRVHSLYEFGDIYL